MARGPIKGPAKYIYITHTHQASGIRHEFAHGVDNRALCGRARLYAHSDGGNSFMGQAQRFLCDSHVRPYLLVVRTPLLCWCMRVSVFTLDHMYGVGGLRGKARVFEDLSSLS